MMTLKLEITNKVLVGLNDGGSLPLEQCACGQKFESWHFILDSDPTYKSECPQCGRKMWFSLEIKVWQELREEDRLRNRPLAPYNRPVSPELFTILSEGFPESAYDES